MGMDRMDQQVRQVRQVQFHLSTLVGTLTGEALRTQSVSFVANEVREYHDTAEERAVGKIGSPIA